jgi:hypothetical protein
MGEYKGSGKGKEWIEKELGWTAEIVQHPPKPCGVWAPADEVIDWSKVHRLGFAYCLVDGWWKEISRGSGRVSDEQRL